MFDPAALKGADLTPPMQQFSGSDGNRMPWAACFRPSLPAPSGAAVAPADARGHDPCPANRVSGRSAHRGPDAAASRGVRERSAKIWRPAAWRKVERPEVDPDVSALRIVLPRQSAPS